MSRSRNQGVVLDPLFVGATRPAMAWGVTYSALLINVITTAELFLLTKKIQWILVCVPMHAIFWLLCQSEPRFFDLLLLWAKTRGPGLLANGRFWRANSYSPLILDLPNKRGRRRWRFCEQRQQR